MRTFSAQFFFCSSTTERYNHQLSFCCCYTSCSSKTFVIIRAHRFVVSQGLYQLVGLGSLLYSSVGVIRVRTQIFGRFCRAVSVWGHSHVIKVKQLFPPSSHHRLGQSFLGFGLQPTTPKHHCLSPSPSARRARRRS